MNQQATAAPETGYAPVNGMQMYYERHGTGGTPLLLLHGGLFDVEQRTWRAALGLSAAAR